MIYAACDAGSKHRLSWLEPIILAVRLSRSACFTLNAQAAVFTSDMRMEASRLQITPDDGMKVSGNTRGVARLMKDGSAIAEQIHGNRLSVLCGLIVDESTVPRTGLRFA